MHFLPVFKWGPLFSYLRPAPCTTIFLRIQIVNLMCISIS